MLDITASLPLVDVVRFSLRNGNTAYRLPATTEFKMAQHIEYLCELRDAIYDTQYLLLGTNLFSRVLYYAKQVMGDELQVPEPVAGDINPPTRFVLNGVLHINAKEYEGVKVFESRPMFLGADVLIPIYRQDHVKAVAYAEEWITPPNVTPPEVIVPPTKPFARQLSWAAPDKSLYPIARDPKTKLEAAILSKTAISLIGLPILVLDTEIKKAILKEGETPIVGIEYCAGFADFENMGISCLGVYDFKEDRNLIFMDDNMDQLRALIEERELFVGFNNVRFDNKLWEANDIHIPEDRSYDLLLDMWNSMGFTEEFTKETHAGFGLDATSSANLGAGKNDNPAMAPVNYQRGEFGKLIRYQMGDVDLTRQLFIAAVEHNGLINPKTGEHLELLTLKGIIRHSRFEDQAKWMESKPNDVAVALAKMAVN